MANCVYVVARMVHFYNAGKHGKRHAVPTHKPQAVSDWLNPYSLEIILAFGSIANLA